MDDRNAQVGWTGAQWNRVRQEVLRSWQSVRVAGSFLPVYGPLPPGTQVVPSEILDPVTGRVDDKATAVVLEISLQVTLSRQQVMDEDLSSALLEFRRRATQVGQLEDWYIFNGQYPRGGPQGVVSDRVAGYIGSRNAPELEGNDAKRPYRPSVLYSMSVSGIEDPIDGIDPLRQRDILMTRNPGALGLLEGAAQLKVRNLDQDDDQLSITRPTPQPLTNHGLTNAIVAAITTLNQRGYVAPYACVFALDPFLELSNPLPNGAFPRDRIEPLVGRAILHASAIDILPKGVASATDWTKRGLLLSLAGDPIDIAIVAEATPEFRQVNDKGDYIFAVFERFALRIKDPNAIVTLAFDEPPKKALEGPHSEAPEDP